MLAIFGGVGIAALAGCAADSSSSTSTASDSTAGGPPNGAPPDGGGGMGGDSSVEVAEGEIPEETAGPYPGDGSNGPNVLAESGVVRSDITSSFGDASGVAEGVPVTVKLKVYDLNGDDATPLAGAAVYLWHCDREGSYSMYDGDASGENYLRGVQEAADDGTLEFTTIFPACYAGRWPHMHFEVYESLDDRHQRDQQAAYLPARAPAGRLRGRLRDRGLRAVGLQPGPGQPRQRRHLLRRLLAPDGQGDRLGRRGVRRHAQRPGLRRVAAS